jgi:serine O-acetyltransferase
MTHVTLWQQLRDQAKVMQEREPHLARFLAECVGDRPNFEESLSFVLAYELADTALYVDALRQVFIEEFKFNASLAAAAQADLMAILERDPAARLVLEPFLFFKGYHALESYRIAHSLWGRGRESMALYLQSRVARRFSVDIHPAAHIGCGVMFDHANGIVIGETAVVEDNVSFLHSVTLGGTGKEQGDRHPKIRSGVMIGAGAKVLGNIEVGQGSRIAAGSVVLENVPANVTVAGVPAKIVGAAGKNQPALVMDQWIEDFR